MLWVVERLDVADHDPVALIDDALAKVATTALQLVLESRPKLPVYDPVEETTRVSVAAREVLVSCCWSPKPEPGVTVPPKLFTVPNPANISSVEVLVVAVAPVLGDELLPCA